MLGAVGAYDWSGGIFLYGNDGSPSFINVSSSSKDMSDAYLGKRKQILLFWALGLCWSCWVKSVLNLSPWEEGMREEVEQVFGREA